MHLPYDSPNYEIGSSLINWLASDGRRSLHGLRPAASDYRTHCLWSAQGQDTGPRRCQEGSLRHSGSFAITGGETCLCSGVRTDRERSCSTELIYPDGTAEGFQINCGIRIFGGGGRGYPKKSFRLLFKEIYGPTKLKYPFFDGCPVDRFDTLVLRSTIDSSWQDENYLSSYPRPRAQYIRDLWNKDTERDMGQELVLYNNYMHLYVNGTYWGLYSPAERPDASYMAERLGGEKEDYDAFSSVRLVDGTFDAWNEMMDIANAGVSGDAQYQSLCDRLDVDRLIDYMLANLYSSNNDWGSHNWRAAGPRVPGQGGFRCFTWDSEVCFDTGWGGQVRDPDYDNVSTLGNFNGSPSRLYHQLKQNAEYRLLFGDHVHRHCFNGGALTREKVEARWMARANEIDCAIVAESARWGDVRGDYPPLTRDAHWITEQNRLLQWFTDRTGYLVGFLRNNNLYPDTDAPPFNIDGQYQHGGAVDPCSVLTMTGPIDATIYYTTDESDPREVGGAVTSGALVYSGSISLTESVHVKSRARDNSTNEWSALNEAVFAVGPVMDNLRITEIMYHPADAPAGDPNAEFIELKNIGAETINLNLVSFTNGIDFTFGDVNLSAGDHIVVVKEQSAFGPQYPSFSGTLAGQYTGSLENAGERIELEDAIGRTIQDFKYKDGWYDITDGDGYSLRINDPTGTDPNTWGYKRGWSASTELLGSPGADDTGHKYGDIVINEVLAHSDGDPNDWIELRNTTGSPIDISGWFLSDSGKDDPNLMKYEVPASTSIPANGYLVFTQDDHFGGFFGLSENGETAYLTSGLDGNGKLTGYREKEDFGASENNVAFGKYQKSTGTYNFVAMNTKTPGGSYEGAVNDIPKVGPVVISEIMYDPNWLVGSLSPVGSVSDMTARQVRRRSLGVPSTTSAMSWEICVHYGNSVWTV